MTHSDFALLRRNRAYDPDDIDEEKIVAALKRIAGGRRTRRPKVVMT